MRTTVTLDPDVARDIKDFARRRHLTFKAALNMVLRRGLQTRAPSGEPFRVSAHRCGFRPGLDPTKLGQIADELEVADFIAELGSR